MALSRLCVAAAAVVAVTTAGCASKTAPPEVAPGLAAAASSTQTTAGAGTDATGGATGRTGATSPATGNDRSQPVGPAADNPVNAPSVSLAGLPVGGSGNVLDEGTGLQCLEANWRGDPGTPADLTPGITVAVTAITFEPAVFETTTSPDCGLPSCRSFVFSGDARACGLAVLPNGSPDDPGAQHVLVLGGTARFAGVSAHRREEFLAAQASIQDRFVELSPPPEATSGDTGGTTAGGGAGGQQSSPAVPTETSTAPSSAAASAGDPSGSPGGS
jgi:hypothetical protein